MASIKSKFSIGQAVSVAKSGKAGTVTSIVINKDGVSVDVQVGNAKRPWRYAESALQTQAEAAKAAKAKAKPAVAKAPAKPAEKKAPAKAKAKKAPAKKAK